MKSYKLNEHEKALWVILKDDGRFPNNGKLPLLLYVGVLKLSEGASSVESLFYKNRWLYSWRDGVYGFHHYHSTAHEVLGVYGGSAEVQFGGEDGIKSIVNTGDVVVIPAGVSHKKVKSSAGFSVIGAYPKGQMVDMQYGNDGERPRTDQNIARLSYPETDPVYGTAGPLLDLWKG
ncbi:MAG: hypothetical protein JSV25_15170 [Spirochaetota bacterium]|nr:MAG: hypothetical protein JSV25_15170 [Spirochaetota bacterium]